MSTQCVDSLAIATLSQVICHEAPSAVEEFRLEMERVRMWAEDLSAAMLSPCPLYLTWRELAKDRQESCTIWVHKIDDAVEILRAARSVTGSPVVALRSTRAAIENAHRALISDDSDDDSSDLDGNSEETEASEPDFDGPPLCSVCRAQYDGHTDFFVLPCGRLVCRPCHDRDASLAPPTVFVSDCFAR